MFYSITENSEYVKNKKKFFVVFLFKLILCEFQSYWKSFFIHNINNCLEPRIFVLIDTSRFHYNFVESHIFFQDTTSIYKGNEGKNFFLASGCALRFHLFNFTLLFFFFPTKKYVCQNTKYLSKYKSNGDFCFMCFFGTYEQHYINVVMQDMKN